jgi:tetratricopeptide (TPR) repeat protein
MRSGFWKRTPVALLFAALVLPTAWAEDSRWDELIRAGNAALEARRYNEAERYFKAALQEAEGLGPRDPALIDSLRALCNLYQQQGKTPPQEPFRRRILGIQQDLLGEAHPDLVPPLLELAGLYSVLQKPAMAEPLLRRALEIQESQLGPNDPETVNLVNTLGSTCLELRKFSEAEELFRRSLLTHEATQPPETNALVHDLVNLSAVYRSQEKNEEAEALIRRASELQDTKGENSGGIAAGLGRFYWAQGRYAEAEPLLLRGLEYEEKVMGPEHPNVLAYLGELANFYRIQGRETEASAFAERALAMAAKAKEQKEEPNNDADLNRVMRLISSGSTLMDRGEYARAEELYREALELEQKAEPGQYITEAYILSGLGTAKCRQGRYEEAVPLFKRSIEMAGKAVGPDHPTTVEQYLTLALCQVYAGKYQEAEALYKRLIDRLDKAGGPVQPALLRVLSQYSRLLRRMNREAGAQRVEDRIKELTSQMRQENPSP